MIKLISKDNPEILAFRVSEELEQDDVDWLVKRIVKKEDDSDHKVLLYVEFEQFGELTFARVWDQFKMFMGHLIKLMTNVDKIAVVTSNESLREKLVIEFALIPTISFNSYRDDQKELAVKWLAEI